MEVVYRGMIAVFPPDQGDGWSVEEMFAVNKNKVCYHESNRTLWPVGTVHSVHAHLHYGNL